MNLTDDDKIQYLANLAAVSRSDGSISPNEANAVAEAQKRIGARKTALRKADALAEKDDFTPVMVGCFSTRIANLEDMIAVALADGSIDKAETPIILAFAREIGITNEQLQLILSEVRAHASSDSATRVCPNCSTTIPRENKFCPECGKPLENSDKAAAVAVQYAVPDSGISIEFAESTASGFVDAVRKAKAAPENAECVKGKKTWYVATWPKHQIASAVELVSDLKGMRNRKVWIDGSEARWDEVFGFTWCSEQRETAYRPLEYCFGIDEKRLNIWGCKNARMDWAKWSDWFGYGSFKKGGLFKSGHIFVFDKKRIRHELETNLHRFRYCPHLNFELIEAILQHLPEQVEVSPNGDWTYKRDYDESPGAIRIKLKTVEDGYSYTDEFHSSGVEPRTSAIGLRILKSALTSAGVDSSGLKGLMSYRGE